MTLTQLNTLIEGIATDVSGINRYFYGPISDENLNDSQDYPALIQLIDSYSIVGALGQERPQWPINLYLVDQIYNDPDEATWKAKYEELAGYVEQVYMKLREAGTGTSYGFILSDADIQPVLHWENATGVVGWLLSVTIQDEDIIDCEPFTGSSLCFEISDATWVQIKACMSAAQITAATDDLCEGAGSFDLSIAQAPLTVAVDADKTIQVQNSAGVNFNDDQVSAAEVGDTINIALADGFVRIVWDGGSSDETFLRSANPRVDLVDSGGNFVPAPTITEPISNLFNVALQSVPVEINTGGVTEDTVSPAWTAYDIMLIDQEGNPVTPTNIDGATDREITLTLPQLVADFSVDDSTPTVGEEITFTDDSSDSPDHWAWDFGDGTFDQVQNPTKTYLIPNVYDVYLFAANKAADLAGFEEKENFITAAGILDTYCSDAFIGCGRILLQRLYSGNGLEVRRTGTAGQQDFGYTDGILDEFTTYVGANDGLAETLYNQVGNNFNQSTDILQPKLINAGVLFTDFGGGFAMEFNDSEYLQATRENFWGVDRTKLFMLFAFSCDGTTAANTNSVLSQYENSGNQISWRGGYIKSTERVFAQYSSDGSTQQFIDFSGVILNEFAVVAIQIDTSESVNDRVKAWKYNSLGETSLTRVSTTGNVTGDLLNSTSDFMIGASNPSSPSAFFGGMISPYLIATPQLISDANRATIGNYIYSLITEPL